ncbi:MAG: hypothetical protein AAFX05_09420 [Planctomycetota bacterium]
MSTDAPPIPDPLSASTRRLHEQWLRELTVLPTAAGREHRVIAWIEAWLSERTDLALTRDDVGNMLIRHRDADPSRPALLITAHLDHPAFVVESIVGPQTLRLSFRGGVMDPYFEDAPIEIVTASGDVVSATLLETGKADPFRDCLAELGGEADGIAVGDIARWSMPQPEEIDGVWHTHACDDLAAVAAACAAMDELHGREEARHVGLLFTLAEEVGFVGAVAACRSGFIPADARCVLLENSRAFEESPLGGGPIVRVGDRISTFSPALTSAYAKLAEQIVASRSDDAPFAWQRKLMPGGACEATVYQAFGWESTCLCLPLGNYHNMADLTAVQAGDEQAVATARCGREHIALSDYHDLIDLLIASGVCLASVQPMTERLERIYNERKVVLEDRSVFDATPDAEGATWGLGSGA